MNYNWTKSKERILLSKLLTSQKFNHGVTCFFVPLTKVIGAKLFEHSKERNQALTLQKKAAKHGLAPKAGEKFSFSWRVFPWDLFEDEPQVIKIYGYLTQIAETPITLSPKEEEELEKRLRDIGISAFDLHEDNIGKIGKNILCIDFDHESVEAI